MRVGVAVNKEHWSCQLVEREFGRQYGLVVIAPGFVAPIQSVGQRICRVYANSPLHITRDFVDIVYGQVSLVGG